MADNDTRLAITIEANTKAMENSLKRLEGVVSKSFTAQTRAVKSLDSQLRAISGTALKAASALGIAFSARALGNFIVSSVKAGEAIGDTAEKLGITAEAFQELSYVADQNGASADDLQAAFKGMAKLLGEVERHSASAKAELKNLGLTFADLQGQSPDQAFTILLDSVGKIADPTLRAAEAQKIFSKSGQQVLQLANLGAAGLDALRQRARDLGLVLSNETIKKSQDAADALGEIAIATRDAGIAIGSALAPLIKHLAEIFTSADFQNGIAAFAKQLGGVVELVGKNPWLLQVYGGAQAGMAIGGAVAGPVGMAVGGALGAGGSYLYGTPQGQELQKNIPSPLGVVGGAAQAGVNAIFGAPTPPQTGPLPADSIVFWNDFLDEGHTVDELPPGRIQDYFRRNGANLGGARRAPGSAPRQSGQMVTGLTGLTGLPGVTAPAGASGAGGGDGFTDPAVEAQRKKYEELAAAIGLEFTNLNKSRREQEIANEVAKLGADVTGVQKKKIEELAGAYFDAAEAQKSINDATALFADTAYSAFDGLITGAKSLKDTLGDVIAKLGEAVLQASLLGQGPLAGLFGTTPAGGGPVGGLFGSLLGGLFGHRAGGGPVTGGMPYMVGERGPELFIPRGGGTIAANSSMGGAGGRVDVYVHNIPSPLLDQHIDARSTGVSVRVFQAGARQQSRKQELAA